MSARAVDRLLSWVCQAWAAGRRERVQRDAARLYALVDLNTWALRVRTLSQQPWAPWIRGGRQVVPLWGRLPMRGTRAELMQALTKQ